ncbi:helicase-associated domain-containing protein [Gordonia paraffinivorans]|uniref:helicase-associated domain-containing protein n=1 Tax=Gordonia paraffinivorans TaxID=175628 RepID=UPI001E45188A|nr:helicase-associated domain-containing protein [Gordonia paraffinivorans]MCD2147309.1 helicase-associated domain-containing protein [Gordonia paraffinivorans]
MSSDDQHAGLAAELAARSDDELTELLIERPDLASPTPQGTRVLAQRALSAASLTVAGEDLDVLSVAVLEQVIAFRTDTSKRKPKSRTAASIVKALSGRTDADEVRARIELLRRRAILWGKDSSLFAGDHVDAALPWKARHLTGPLAGRSGEEIAAMIAELPERPRELLETLARGPALGRSRDAAPDADPTAPVAQLISSGLLARVDHQTVELPPMVGAVIRGEPAWHTDTLAPPPLHEPGAKPRFPTKAVDAAGGGEALELIRHLTAILNVLGATPAAVLRSGALGVRELRRIAKLTKLETGRVALLVELAGYLRLIDAGFPEPPPPDDTGEQAFAPTQTADTWLHQPRERQWLALADAWLHMPRRAWQVGEPDRDGNAMATLSSELHDSYAPIQRQLILSTLAQADPAVAVTPDAVLASLHWHRPRLIRRFSRHLVAETLREARELGLVAHDALTSVGRAYTVEPEPGADPADADAVVLAAMRAALPEPVDHFLTQADLTLTVPGPMTPELAEQVELVADLESGGAASVYRITPETVRRALDAGRSANELQEMFTRHSRTPVPQSLTYLIEDVARKHGQLRVGVASAFLRCEDPTVLAAVMRSPAAEALALRSLAPTVAVSPSDVRDVIDQLRAAGFAPAGEDSTGALVDLRERGSRVAVSRARRQAQPRRGTPSVEQLRAVVTRIRSTDRAAAATPARNPSSAPVRATGGGESSTALIQLALRANRRLRVGYVDAQGSASRHVVTPKILGAGQLVAVEDGTDTEQRFSLHRITSVELLDD